MASEAAHTRWWQIFEIIVGLPFVGGIALQLAMPRALHGGLLSPIIMTVGAALIIVGVTLVVLARRELARAGQPTDPGLPTSTLIMTGIFAVSRNPLYLGGVCVLAGLALAFNLPWSLALLLPALVACQSMLIAPEERYLAARFGAEYQRYAASVPRWIGRARHR
jgi:protein-S-isoprenylcysteine O-methyltransferase Ste14